MTAIRELTAAHRLVIAPERSEKAVLPGGDLRDYSNAPGQVCHGANGATESKS